METTAAPVQEDRSEKIPICLGLALNKSFIFSIGGIAKFSALLLALICFICVEATDWRYCIFWSTYRFMGFVTMTAFWSTLILVVVYILSLDQKIPFIHWPLTELIWSAVDTGFFFIASCILAAHTCGIGGFTAGAVFGFFSTGAYGLNTVMAFLRFRQYQSERSGGQSGQGVSNAPAAAVSDPEKSPTAYS